MVMLEHLFSKDTKPKRVVVLGAQGFIGRNLVMKLSQADVNVLALGRVQCDLVSKEAPEKLGALMEGGDVLVFISALAPAKDAAMLADNMEMASNVIKALENIHLSHLIYVSSDAVYKDTDQPMTEDAIAQPDSIHGVMHLAREIALLSSIACPIGILRPTLVYGAGDPHNGYGPNKFRRAVQQGEDIILFGAGEELRDHVHVHDVAGLLERMILRRSTGVLNAATGTVTSFYDIAEMTIHALKSKVKIVTTERRQPMPHNGYRAFDPGATLAAFPDFQYMPLVDGIKASLES